MHKNHKPVTIKLAHINDTHSYFEPSSMQLTVRVANKTMTPYVSAGGFARIATRVSQLRDEAERQNKGFLFLHAGDCFQGTLYFSLFKGQANAELLSALNLDAMALGNHELDIGNEPVAQFVRQINFPLLAGNWDLTQENADKALTLNDQSRLYSWDPASQGAQYITKLVDGEAVAIFGLSLDKMSEIANPDPDTPFVNAVETARNTVARIHADGINKIILLSHLGYDGDLELAKQVTGIGLIVGGHSHRLQGDFSAIGLGCDDEYGIKVAGTHIVQAGYHALTMGQCEITFAADGSVDRFVGGNELLIGRRMFLDSSLDTQACESEYQQVATLIEQQANVVVCKKDPVVHATLTDKYAPKVRALQNTIIGHAGQKLRHVRLPDEQGGSALAPLIARSFVEVLNQRGFDVQFAIHNAGGVRNSIEAGAISIADIAGKILPFVVPLGTYQVQGQHLAAALEGAIDNAYSNGVEGTGSGSFPYTHNLRFEYHAEKPKGKRINQLEICLEGRWQAVEGHVWYRGVSSAYTMKGKEGYNALTHMRGEGHTTTISMADCFIEYLQHHQHPLLPDINANRIVAAGH